MKTARIGDGQDSPGVERSTRMSDPKLTSLYVTGEPLSNKDFDELPGNIRKSYLLMELMEEDLSKRIRKLRIKTSP